MTVYDLIKLLCQVPPNTPVKLYDPDGLLDFNLDVWAAGCDETVPETVVISREL
jgi:hypothetical protein